MENADVLMLKNKMFEELYPCYFGEAVCKPLHSFGPAVRSNHLLHFVLSGKGVFYQDEASYLISAGEGFLIEPNEQTFYQADAEDPWTYIWIGFSGTRAGAYMEMLGLNHRHPVFRSQHGDRLKKLVEEMLANRTPCVENEFRAQSLLCAFFAELAMDLSFRPESTASADRQNYYVRKAVEFIQNNYSNGITVSDVADYVAINRSYLFTLFNKVLGQSPQKYLTNFRLTRGAELLSTTDFSVENVALSCGYRDPLVFSKAFKAFKGMTPVHYRKCNREHPAVNPADLREPERLLK